MPPIPGKPKPPEPRRYRYGIDAFICVCGAIHWYDARKCAGCKRNGPLTMVPREELKKMRGTPATLTDDEEVEDEEDDDEDFDDEEDDEDDDE